MTVKNIRYEDWLAKQMKNPEFREAVEDQEIAYHIGRLRMLKGITQAQLAEMVGTKQSSIARMESGTTMPRLSFLRKVVTALGGRVEIKILSEDEIIQEYEFSTSTGDEDDLEYASYAISLDQKPRYSWGINPIDPANDLKKVEEFAYND